MGKGGCELASPVQAQLKQPLGAVPEGVAKAQRAILQNKGGYLVPPCPEHERAGIYGEARLEKKVERA